MDAAFDFDLIVEEYQGRVIRYLAGLLGDAALARDLTQETFLRVHKGLEALRSPGGRTALDLPDRLQPRPGLPPEPDLPPGSANRFSRGRAARWPGHGTVTFERRAVSGGPPRAGRDGRVSPALHPPASRSLPSLPDLEGSGGAGGGGRGRDPRLLRRGGEGTDSPRPEKAPRAASTGVSLLSGRARRPQL